MSPRPNTHQVWNVDYEYVEHIGTRESCERWLANVKGLFGHSTIRYVIEERRRSR